MIFILIYLRIYLLYYLMFSDNEYFMTLDCQMYDNKVDHWASAWSSGELVKMRTQGGVTYCAWSKNRKNANHISCCFKFNDRESMDNYDKQIQNVIQQKREVWETMGDLNSLEKRKWHMLKECMLDLDMLGVMNQTDDVFWFARHKVDNKEDWVNSAVESTKMGAWNNVRWWGLMENVDNPDEVACCLRIPRKNLSELLTSCWEGVGSWRSMMSVDVNSIDLTFYNVQYETMYNKMPGMPDEVWQQLYKRTGHGVVCNSRKSNLEVLKEMHQLWASGQVDKLLEHVADDVETVHHGDNRVPFMGHFNGHDGVREWIELYAQEIEHLSPPNMTDYAAAGDVVYHQYSARVKIVKTGKEVDIVSINKFTFNSDGKVTSLVFSGNTHEVADAYSM